MWDYNDLISFPVRCPKVVAEHSLILAKRMGLSRSALVRILLEAAIYNAKWQCEKSATLQQFAQHSVNDACKIFDISFLNKDNKSLDKAA